MTQADRNKLLRSLPGVDALLQQPEAAALMDAYGRSLTVEAVRQALDQARAAILQQDPPPPPNGNLLKQAKAWLQTLTAPTLFPVINATGVIVHTNLGRAPLSQATRRAIDAIGAGYSTLEYDIAAGARGSRSVHAEQLLQRITGAEAALVVNNNAAAVLLMLMGLCQGHEVIISRGQLVEIGGGFRVPDVMAQSGAKLVEVGTTNRTHLRDYAAAINENTAAILVAHHSNFKIVGFTSEPSLAELAELAHAHNLPLLYDQGSGALLDTAPFGLDPEPTVLDGLAAGCDLVTFSGDKLLGGPQAGIIAGRAESVQALKRHPFARAVRPDKLCLAGLAATLTHYLLDEALTQIPVWQMIAAPLAALEALAVSWRDHLRASGIEAAVMDGRSTVGGGSLPGTTMPTKLVALTPTNVTAYEAALRQGETAVIGRIQENKFLIDPRTVRPEQVDMLLNELVHCFRMLAE